MYDYSVGDNINDYINYFGFFYENKLIVIPESNKLYSGTNVTELDKPKEGS